MKDELSRIIAGILRTLVKATQQDRIDFDEDLAHEQIIYIITSELEKAEKWDRVKEISLLKGKSDCTGCPITERTGCGLLLCNSAYTIIKAIEGGSK